MSELKKNEGFDFSLAKKRAYVSREREKYCQVKRRSVSPSFWWQGGAALTFHDEADKK